MAALPVKNSCQTDADSRCVYFSRKKKCWKYREGKKALIMDIILFSRGRKKSEKWNFIGGFGRQRKMLCFWYREYAFQKWQSEFAQVLVEKQLRGGFSMAHGVILGIPGRTPGHMCLGLLLRR